METKFIKEINYKRLEPVLLRINQNNINPSDNITHKYNLHYKNFLKSFQEFLIGNNIFLNKYLKRTEFSLRELRKNGRCFNIYHHEISIKIPSHLYKITPEPGYVQINLSNDINADPSTYKVFQKWIDTSKIVVAQKFNKWAEETLMEMFKIKSFADPENYVNMEKYSFSIEKTDTHDFKFHIQKNNSADEFEVYMTFVLHFDTFPSVFLDQHNENSGEAWLAVPIIPKDKLNADYKRWRYSFPNVEKKMLTDQNYLKCVFKLMKILRETADLSHLSNYHIKSVFLMEVKNQKPDFWKKGFSYLFISMICRLQLAMESKKIPFHWNESVNLLDDLSCEEIEKTRKSLNSIIYKIYESFSSTPVVKLEDFFVTVDDDDDVLSVTMSKYSIS